MNLMIAIVLIIVALLLGVIIGYNAARLLWIKRLINEYYAGDLVINMEDVESDTISIDFSRNPKELMAYNYVLIGVKIRQ